MSNYIVVPQKSEVVKDRYDFYSLVEKENEAGEKVNIKEKVGDYSVSELEIQKENIEKQLAEINDKISAIQTTEK